MGNADCLTVRSLLVSDILITEHKFGQQLAERIKLTAKFNLGLMAKLRVKYILIS